MAKAILGINPGLKFFDRLSTLGRLSLIFLVSLIIGIGFFFNPLVGIGLFIAVACGLAIILEPYAGLLLFLFLLYVRPNEIIKALVPLRLVMAVAVGTLLIWLANMIFKRNFRLIKSPLNFLMMAFLVVVSLSNIMNLPPYIDGAKAAFSDFVKIFIFFVLMVNLISTPSRLKIFTWFLILFTGFVAYSGVYHHNTGMTLAGTMPNVGDGRVAGVGIFADPNAIALAIVMTIPFIYNFMVSKTNLFGKLLLIGIVCLDLYGFYLTKSRGGILSMLAVLFLISTQAGSFRFKLTGGIIFFLGLLVISNFLPEDLVSRAGSISEGAQDESVEVRQQAWYHGLGLFKSDPVFGVGVGRFTDETSHTAHNSFILAAAEMGLVGVTIWIALIYISLKDLVMLKKEWSTTIPPPSDDDEMSIFAREDEESGLPQVKDIPYMKRFPDAVIISIIGFLVGAAFLSYTYSYLLYILIGLAAVVGVIGREEGKVPMKLTSKDLFNISAMVGAGLFLWWLALTVLYRTGS